MGAVLNGADGGNEYGYGSEYGEALRMPRATQAEAGNQRQGAADAPAAAAEAGNIPPPPPPPPAYVNDPVAAAAAAAADEDTYRAGNGDTKKSRLFSRCRTETCALPRDEDNARATARRRRAGCSSRFAQDLSASPEGEGPAVLLGRCRATT